MPFVNLIHGVDSLKLLLQETQTSKKSDRIIGLLTSNAHIAEEGN
jgi:hypothetical protein